MLLTEFGKVRSCPTASLVVSRTICLYPCGKPHLHALTTVKSRMFFDAHEDSQQQPITHCTRIQVYTFNAVNV